MKPKYQVMVEGVIRRLRRLLGLASTDELFVREELTKLVDEVDQPKEEAKETTPPE